MEASPMIAGWGALPTGWPTARQRRHLTRALAAVVVLAAVLLASRRLAGALERPLPAVGLIVVGLALAGARLASSAISDHPSRRDGPALRMEPIATLATLVAGWSVSLPGSSGLGLAVLWLSIIGGEALAWRSLLREPNRSKNSGRGETGSAAGGRSIGRDPVDRSPEDIEVTPMVELADADTRQHLVLAHTTDGRDVLHGWSRVTFAPGQRTAAIHVAFCPPFLAIPGVWVQASTGPDCRVKIGQLMPYGMRLDVRLSQVDREAVEVTVAFAAEGEVFAM
jgi:hypothetical protein